MSDWELSRRLTNAYNRQDADKLRELLGEATGEQIIRLVVCSEIDSSYIQRILNNGLRGKDSPALSQSGWSSSRLGGRDVSEIHPLGNHDAP